MKNVVILQHAWEDPKGYLGDLLDKHAIVYTVIDVEQEAVPDLTEYGAVVVLGGPQHVYAEEQHPYLRQVKERLRAGVEQSIPCLGICLGGQLLAAALNAEVRKHTMAEVGFFDIAFTEAGLQDPLYAELPGYQKTFHWHEDIFDLPEGAVLLATNQNAPNQAFRYGRNAYGIQYHIEVSPDVLDTWLYHPSLKESMLATIGLDAYNTLEREREGNVMIYSEHTRIMFENFLRISQLI